MPKLFYQGHASFRLTTDSGKVVFIDPFCGVGYKTHADLVLITLCCHRLFGGLVCS